MLHSSPPLDPKALIVLLPGWGAYEIGWHLLKSRFVNQGYDVLSVTYPPHLNRGTSHSIEQASQATEHFLDASNVRDAYEHICLLGHSMGGLVGRHLIQIRGRDDLVDSYVSMGTPHKGTFLGRFAPFSVSAKEMATGSGFLKELNETPWPQDLPALAIQAGLEQLIWPQSNAKFDIATNVRVNFVAHASLLLSKRVFWEMYSFLTYDVLDWTGEHIADSGHASDVRLTHKVPPLKVNRPYPRSA